MPRSSNRAGAAESHEKLRADPSFEAWLRHLLQPEADPSGVGPEAAAWQSDLPPEQTLAYATELFGEAPARLAPYTEVQAGEGLWRLIDVTGCSNLAGLLDRSVPVQSRLGLVHSIGALFRHYFAPRCTPVLSHLDEPGAAALNAVCYMWWDIFPWCGGAASPESAQLDEACLAVMELVLALPSAACQESALHGLGHWGHAHPARCEAIIDRFLSAHPCLRPELRRYAVNARRRNVQ